MGLRGTWLLGQKKKERPLRLERGGDQVIVAGISVNIEDI